MGFHKLIYTGERLVSFSIRTASELRIEHRLNRAGSE